jgi:hypothetical protein
MLALRHVINDAAYMQHVEMQVNDDLGQLRLFFLMVLKYHMWLIGHAMITVVSRICDGVFQDHDSV